MKYWLQYNDIEMYSTHNEEKSVVADRFIRTLMNTIYKYMTSISKNVYIQKLDDIVNKYNNTYHSPIKMKPVDIKSSTYIDCCIENNKKDPNFEVGDNVRKSIKKTIFGKDYNPNWSEEVQLLKKLHILCRGHMLSVILTV